MKINFLIFWGTGFHLVDNNFFYGENTMENIFIVFVLIHVKKTQDLLSDISKLDELIKVSIL